MNRLDSGLNYAQNVWKMWKFRGANWKSRYMWKLWKLNQRLWSADGHGIWCEMDIKHIHPMEVFELGGWQMQLLHQTEFSNSLKRYTGQSVKYEPGYFQYYWFFLCNFSNAYTLYTAYTVIKLYDYSVYRGFYMIDITARKIAKIFVNL